MAAGAYPHKWDVYIESLDGEVVRPLIKSSSHSVPRLLYGSRKPTAEEILKEITKYEEENEITNADKMKRFSGA